jgi:hypothetical protein
MSDKLKTLFLAILLAAALVWSLAYVGFITLVLLGFLWIALLIFPGLRGRTAIYLHVIALTVVPYTLRAFPGGEYLNSRITSVDIHSGQLRFERYFLYFPVSSRIEETEVSKHVPLQRAPAWRAVSQIDGAGDIRLAYDYHGAEEQIRQIESAWAMEKSSEKQRRADAAKFIEAWTANKTYLPASAVVHAVAVRANGSAAD